MFKAQRDALIDTYVNKAELISFEGYDIYAVNAPSEVRSEVGAILAEKTNSFALIFYYEPGTWKCSLRSVKDFDVVPIAEKFGGGGHKNAAAFYLTASFPITFT
jgi:nanoRNase/pAp phosphatase (c-di-AMP/oligoRNAs hydrolase)